MPPSPATPQKLIFLTLESPFPANGGAHLRDAHLIDIFRETMEVEVLCLTAKYIDSASARLANEEVVTSRVPNTHVLPEGVSVTRMKRRSRPLWKRALHLMQLEVQADYSEDIAQALRLRAEPGKLLWISRLGMGKYIELARKLGYRTVLDQHQVETHVLWSNAYADATRLATAVKGVPRLMIAAQCGYYEGRVCSQSDAVVATSDLDASRILKLAPDAIVHVIPNALNCSKYVPLRQQNGRTLFFSGALNYGPNFEGLTWFVNDILPRLRATLGTECPRLVVAGSNPTPELQQLLERAGAELHADPPSLLPLLADAAIVIIPVRSGRSMRFKILEAMAAGRAVVTTPRGTEGLTLAPGYDMWIADAADKFATAILRLLTDPQLRSETGIHAGQTVDARFDWKYARKLVENLLGRLARPETAIKSP